METTPGLINLDSLIGNLEDEDCEPLVLKIAIEVTESLHEAYARDRDDGSDSSYSEFARNVSENMDTMIEEALLDREEKTKRITAARHSKAKELEEKQKSFAQGKKHPSAKGKQPFGDKPNETKKKFKKVLPKKNEKVKDIVKSATKSDKSGERVTDTNLPSKMKNVTVQNFDIDSTPSQSDDESNLNLEEYNKIISCYQKAFTVKSLNRSEKDKSCESSDSSDDEDSETAKPSHFNPVKKMNYLKKRRNLKKNRSLKERALEKLEKNENPDSNRDNVSVNLNQVKNELSTNTSRSNKHLKQEDPSNVSVKKQSAEKKAQTKRIEKEVVGAKKQAKDSVRVLNKIVVEAQTSKDKFNRSSNQNRKNKKISDDNVSSDGFNKKNLSKANAKDDAVPSSSKPNKLNILKNKETKEVFFDEDEKPSVISIVDLKKFPRSEKQEQDNTDDDPTFRFERLSLSSENEIDWKAVDESNRQRNTSTTDSMPRDKESDDDIEINFKSIIENRKNKNNSLEIPDFNPASSSTNDQREDSSSDYEDKIDAFLDHLK